MASAKKPVPTSQKRVDHKTSIPKGGLKTHDGRVLTLEEEALLAQAKADQVAKAADAEIEKGQYRFDEKQATEAIPVSGTTEAEAPKEAPVIVEKKVETVQNEPKEEAPKKENATTNMIKEKAKEASAKLAEQVKGKAFAKAKEFGKNNFKNILAMAKDKALPKGKALAGKAMKAVTFKKLMMMFKK
ncbi:MAG TPA: hypothetical protein VIT68_04060 [Candidatus Gracilibacteria bacterium]